MDSLSFKEFSKKNCDIEEIIKLLQDTKNLYNDNLILSIKFLSRILFEKDAYTYYHSKNVSQLSLKTARALGLSKKRQYVVFLCGYLHDIGKIGIDDDILKKKGTLSKEEYLSMQQHSILGYRLLSSLPCLKNTANIVRHHHEKFDGSGYPDHLCGAQIPIEARIIAVADTYDAITTRKFLAKRNSAQAIAEIKKNIGSQFDSEIAKEFIDTF